MSRFSDDGPDDLESLLAYGRWCGRRKAVLNGKPGKAALKELEQALLQMTHKRLIEGALCDGSGVCANGAWLYRHYVDGGMTPREAWGKLRREWRQGNRFVVWEQLEQWELLDRTAETVQRDLGITRTLAEVVAFENDEGQPWQASPEARYKNVLTWVQRRINA